MRTSASDSSVNSEPNNTIDMHCGEDVFIHFLGHDLHRLLPRACRQHCCAAETLHKRFALDNSCNWWGKWFRSSRYHIID